MRAYLLIAAGLLLGACGTQTQPIGSAPPAGDARGLYVVGTLAPLGSPEYQAAPAYTRLAGLRRSAARALEVGRIDVRAAREVQARADAVRARLDAAVRAGNVGAELADVGRSLDEIERIVRGRR